MYGYIKIVSIIITLLLVSGCVKIETGGTAEEKKQSSESKASQIRSEWAFKLQQASPSEKAQLFIDFFDNVTGIYLKFGNDMVAQWKEGEQGRQQEIPDTEMRKRIDSWIKTQKPILKAYDDNIEYGFESIKQTGYFGNDILSLLKNVVDQYYDVYTDVFFPQGKVSDYEYKLEDVENKTKLLEGQFKEAITSN